MNDNYILLIGSVARGTNNRNSDIDILRIGTNDTVVDLPSVSGSCPISYIDYDYSTFLDLFNKGSLFLKHAFAEGKLLKGNKSKWDNLKTKFIVSSDFSESIDEYKQVLDYIYRYPDYEKAYVPYLSNIFKSLKNIAIFKLAETGDYEFEKSRALKKCFGLNDKQINILITSNNSFERGYQLSSPEMHNLKLYAEKWKIKHIMLTGGI